MPFLFQLRALHQSACWLTLILLLGWGATARAQSTRIDLGSGDPQVFSTMTPASYGLDFPVLLPEDPMSTLSTGDPFAMGILSDPQALFDTINRSGLPTPPNTPADYNPEDIMLMGNFINETPLLTTFDSPTPGDREIILMDGRHPVYYNLVKLSRTFMFEETPLNRSLPEIPDLSTSFEWQRHHLRQVGPLRMALDLNQAIATINNVFGTASGTQSDVFLTLNPRLYLETGTRGNLSISYAPSFLFYQKHPELNASNENLTVSIRYPFTKLKLGGDFSYQTVSGLFLGSDGYTRQSSSLPRIFATYPIGGKTEITTTYYSVISQTDPGGETIDHNFTVNADHNFSDKLTLGIYQERGYTTDPVGHQLYQTLGLRGIYRPTYHFRFSGKAGMHTRWLRPPAGDLGFIGTPVYDLLASYHRTSRVMLGLRIYRIITTNTFGAVNLQLVNGVEGSYAIRLYDTLDLRLLSGVGHAKQWSGADPKKSDFTFFEGSLVVSYRVSRNVEVAIFDRFQRRLQSSFSENYSTNIIGLAVNLQF